MTKATKAPRAKRSRASSPAATGSELEITPNEHGGRMWLCPHCDAWNDALILRCRNGQCRKVVDLPGGPDKPLPGIELNEHGVVIGGEKTIEIKLGKGKIAEIDIAQVQQGRWVSGHHAESSKEGGNSSALSINVTCFKTEKDAVLHGLERIEQFFKNDTSALKIIANWSKTELEKYSDIETPKVASLPNGKTAWQCRICEAHNDGAETDCVRCHAYPTRIEIETKEIELDRIEPNELNPRHQLTGIEELAASFKEHGQLVEAIGHYVGDFPGDSDPSNTRVVRLIAGHRRLAAAKLAGLSKLRVRIMVVTEKESLEIMGRDNEERENFDAIARARWYQSMMDLNRYSQRDLAAKINKSQSDIAHHLRLLQLPDEWQSRVIAGEISMTMARDLAAYVDNEEVMAGARAYLKIHDLESISTRQWAEALKKLAGVEQAKPEEIEQLEDDEETGTELAAPKEPADRARSPKVEAYRRAWFAAQLVDIVVSEIDGLSVKALESMVREGNRSIMKNWTPTREFFDSLTFSEMVGVIRRDWADLISDELKEAALEMEPEALIEDLMCLEIPLPTPDLLR